jgi:hypothetical protein
MGAHHSSIRARAWKAKSNEFVDPSDFPELLLPELLSKPGDICESYIRYECDGHAVRRQLAGVT